MAAARSHVWAAEPCALPVLCCGYSSWMIAEACSGTDELTWISFLRLLALCMIMHVQLLMVCNLLDVLVHKYQKSMMAILKFLGEE